MPESLCLLGSFMCNGAAKYSLKKKKKDSSQLLKQYNVKGKDFHHSIVRGDKR
jgi:hypothetical protein